MEAPTANDQVCVGVHDLAEGESAPNAQTDMQQANTSL